MKIQAWKKTLSCLVLAAVLIGGAPVRAETTSTATASASSTTAGSTKTTTSAAASQSTTAHTTAGTTKTESTVKAGVGGEIEQYLDRLDPDTAELELALSRSPDGTWSFKAKEEQGAASAPLIIFCILSALVALAIFIIGVRLVDYIRYKNS